MANNKPQPGGAKPQTFGSSFDQLMELTKIPGEGFKELFGFGKAKGTAKPKEELLFDGAEARKKAEKDQQEQANQVRVQNLKEELAKIAHQEQTLRGELTEISQTVVQISKSENLEAPHGIEKIPAKPGIYHKNLYHWLLQEFRKRADEAKEWKSAQQTRVSSKPARGALIWTGDQKKAQEAGAMFLLQG